MLQTKKLLEYLCDVLGERHLAWSKLDFHSMGMLTWSVSDYRESLGYTKVEKWKQMGAIIKNTHNFSVGHVCLDILQNANAWRCVGCGDKNL